MLGTEMQNPASDFSGRGELERHEGIEPVVLSLEDCSSTIELMPRNKVAIPQPRKAGAQSPHLWAFNRCVAGRGYMAQIWILHLFCHTSRRVSTPKTQHFVGCPSGMANLYTTASISSDRRNSQE